MESNASPPPRPAPSPARRRQDIEALFFTSCPRLVYNIWHIGTRQVLTPRLPSPSHPRPRSPPILVRALPRTLFARSFSRRPPGAVRSPRCPRSLSLSPYLSLSLSPSPSLSLSLSLPLSRSLPRTRLALNAARARVPRGEHPSPCRAAHPRPRGEHPSLDGIVGARVLWEGRRPFAVGTQAPSTSWLTLIRVNPN